MSAKLVITPGGEKLAILPAEEYEDLCDSLAIVRHGVCVCEGVAQIFVFFRRQDRQLFTARCNNEFGAHVASFHS